ncbi:hypothetical protein J1G42_02915 [Cellulomonas sp. zg-ZUI222]|uniref:Barstar (barnase inhibitor) domain-containing protein n=1 Tax=Cellulomonas wangleii TaxID=2816956 RepID=A0ABX8D3S4_9CELL|nr:MULTISPECIES: hypothetical protein [Cellulomonas]MBO0898914.1 hypothetical protein [Cellulomonas sp. zg-ZUI22]MBO0919776.1 hypothetical protein [Cellulomonas wangleii]MBO0923799.1 hypothetical protein [Cellulomonas wangleii]MBO0924081.1 hypothetical protein [Cellulomonas wangleii]QVI62106.1 hypothetical protein KG103_17100 [Cellulomonas wangleii]
MKAAYLVSTSSSFEDDVWRAAAALGAVVDGPYAQYRDEQNHYLTIFGALDPRHAHDWRDDLAASPGLDDVPDLSTALAVSVECRWEDLFAAWIARLAARLPEAAWVVDGDGVVWPAAGVDPKTVRL